MGIYEKLSSIQEELKAPKNAYNSFGKYNYRSCEDILEGLKPVLKKYKATLFISDSLELIGDRYYVKAVVRLVDIETGETVENTAYAREELDKKGMDWSQVTGATSSYARKYALNGMFLIDDTKDADTDEYQNQQNKKGAKESASDAKLNEKMKSSVDKTLLPSGGNATPEQLERIKSEMNRTGINEVTILSMFKAKNLESLTDTEAIVILNRFSKTPDKKVEE